MGILILLAAVLAAAESPQFQVGTIDGQTVAGAMVGLTDQELTLDSSGARRTFKLSDVRSLGRVDPAPSHPGGRAVDTAPKPDKTQVWLEMLDGSRLSCTRYEATKGVAHLKLLAGSTLDVPTKFIAQVEFPPPDAQPAAWPELPKDPGGDLIVVRKKEGTDLVEGVAGDVSAETVQFNVDGENVPVKLAKVAGLVYYHPPEAAPLPVAACAIFDAAGWQLKAKSVALAEGQLRVTTTFGPVVTRPLDSIRSIDFSAGRLVYLSDLPAASVDWTPALDFGKENDTLARFYQPHRDKSLDGGPLRLGNKTYAKGLALSCRTRLLFKIADQGKRLQATAGIDDAVRDLGRVELTISGDGRKLYNGKLTGRDKPVDLDLDVADVKKLEIVVDFADGIDAGNYLDLCDARIVK